MCGAEIDFDLIHTGPAREFHVRSAGAGFFLGGWHASILYLCTFFSHAHTVPNSSPHWLPEGRYGWVMGGKAMSERMARSDQTGQKPRCIRRARKNGTAHVLGVHQSRRALSEEMDGRCLFVSTSDLSIA